MSGEQNWGRPHTAKMFNGMPGTCWVHNANAGSRYEKGRPDAFVFTAGRIVCVECKGGMGSLYLGNPDDAEATTGWTMHQRNWWRKVAAATNAPYWIAAWVYSERQPTGRVMQAKASLFLVSPEAWIELEAKVGPLGRKTVALTPELEISDHQFKAFALSEQWARYALVYNEGGWHIPPEHPYWEALK